MDELRMEIRSLLLSAKHGILLKNMQREYEDITLKPLDFRKLNFKNISELMLSMPDVARSTRDESGEIVFHAVSDATTHHIKKLVQSQNTKKKKPSRGGRGRGSRGRGSRGGRGHFRGTHFRGSHFRGTHFSARGSPGLASRGFSRGIRPFGGLGELERHVQRSEVGFFGNYQMDYQMHQGFNEPGNENVSPSGGFHSPMRNLQINVSPHGSRMIRTESSTLNGPKPDELRQFLRDKGTNRNSMNINEGGQGFHQDNLSFGKIHQNVNDNNDNKYKTEIAPRFQRLRQNSGNKSQYPQELSPPHTVENVSQDVRYKSSSLPPQDTKIQDTKPSPFSSQDTKPPTVSQFVNPSPVYIEEKDLSSTAEVPDQNWEPPEDGEEYMKAFLNFFKSQDQRPPDFEIIEGKFAKQKGFYGRLRHSGILYYPLVIQRSKEHAEMCAARMFCRKNNIDLLTSSVKETSIPATQQSTAQTPNSIAASQKSAAQSPSNIAASLNIRSQNTNSPSQFQNSRSQFPTSTSELSLSARPQNGNTVAQSDKEATSSDKEIIYKIYKILKETGFFIKGLPALYKESYQEELSLDPMTELEKWPDFFKLEENIPKRIVVYPVPGALEKAAAPPAGEQPNKTEAAQVVTPQSIPRSPRHKAGRVLDCTVCFYNSPDEFYVRSSKVEQSIQEIEELLNKICPAAAIPEIQSLTVSSMVIGQYLGGWYRAEVKEVQHDTVKVMYIDYGNSESVVLKDLRCLPNSELIVNTPALAIKCALSKPSGSVGWCPDVDAQMEALMDLGVLKSRVIEHRDGLCIVELYHTSGFCINESLSVAGKPPKDVAPSPGKPDPADARSPKPETPKAQVMNAKDGLKSDNGTAAAGDGVMSRLSAGTTPVRTTAVPLQVPPPTPVVLTHEASLSPANTLQSPAPLKPKVKNSTLQSPAPLKPKEKNFKLFPDPLVLPDTEEIAIYICDVLSECSVILRIVDTEYSNKLDALENDIADKFDSWPEPKELSLGSIYAAAVDVDPEVFDEEGEEEEWEDCKRYHRVRVIQKQNDQYYCYFPDHGDFDHLEITDLREMDTKLNTSLPYQAIAAKLKGLDAVPSEHTGFAQRTLKKLVFIDQHSFAAVVTGRYTTQTSHADPAKLSRIMKIISCMNILELDKVEQIYKDIFKEPCGDMEAIFQHIPGFGYWKDCMEIDLFDTEQDDEDVHINTVILDAVNEVVEGKDALAVFNNLFGTAYSSFAELDAKESDEGYNPVEEELISGSGDSMDKQDAVKACEGDISLIKSSDSEGSLPGKKLYTWNSPPAQLTKEFKKSLYKYWSYPLLQPIPVYVVSVESPSNFVAIPAEFQKEFESSQATLNQTLSQSAVSPTSLEIDVLYAVNIEGKFHRAFYRQAVQKMCKVFLPDLCQYEVVSPYQLFVLPERFAKTPFLANNMYIGGVKPIGKSWDNEVKDWFNQHTKQKVLYALVEKEEHFQAGLPPKLVVQLIDTSFEDDLVFVEHMIQTNMAAKA